MRLFERPLELVQLVGREGGPVAAMLLLAAVAVYVVPATRAEFLVAAAAGGVAAVLTWGEKSRASATARVVIRSLSSETVVIRGLIGAVMVIDLSVVAAIIPITRA